MNGKTDLSPFRAAALLAAALCASAGCAGSACRDPWLGPDKAQHFLVGFSIGAATTTLTRVRGGEPARGAALGVGAAAVAGAAKETFDLKVRRSCWSWKDWAWGLLGSLAGAGVSASVSSAGE